MSDNQKKMHVRTVMPMTDYKKLLEKYENKYVPGEERSSEYHHKIRLEAKLKNRMLLVDQLCLEAKYFVITNTQKERVKYLVKIFNNDFKYLHRRVSDETIILAFIVFVKKLETPKLQLKNYSITKKYNLTDAIFELIICRILDYFMMNSDLFIEESLVDNYEDLLNGGYL